MKQIILVLLSYILLNSCCQKQDCASYIERGLVFNNFKANELDTILLVYYPANSNFQTPTDSTITRAIEDGSVTYLPYSLVPITAKNLYALKVYLPSTNQTYLIDNLSFKSVKDCNSCFPVRPKSARMDVLDFYTLNGHKHSGTFITIDK